MEEINLEETSQDFYTNNTKRKILTLGTQENMTDLQNSPKNKKDENQKEFAKHLKNASDNLQQMIKLFLN